MLLRTILLTGLMLLTLTASATDGQVWWGYWNTSMDTVGSQQTVRGTTHCGVRLTTANARLVDGTVYGVRFFLADKSAVSSATIWVSVQQFKGSAAPDLAMKQIALADLRDLSHDGEATEVWFDEPVSILPSTNRYASAYVGYTITTTVDVPLIGAGSTVSMGANTCYVDWQNEESQMGPLAMQLLVSSPNIGQSDVAVGDFDEQLLPVGTAATLDVTMQNLGWGAVESLDVEVSFDGEAQPVQHIVLEKPVDELEATFSVPVRLQVPATARRFGCAVAATKVSGRDNGNAATRGTGSVVALSQLPLKRTVMEELTGTWCPNCPRGLVGLRLLDEQFGDRFVGIAIHGGSGDEPMRVPAYDGSSFVRSVSSDMGGRPSCSVDRYVNCDPYGGLGNYYEYGADFVVGRLLALPTVADLSLTASWTDEARTLLALDVATTFRYAADAAPYALMLVLTADSLTGDSDNWLQVNTLVGKTEYEAYLDEFVYGERRMKLKYDHVAVAVAGVENGISGSIKTPLVADEPQHFAYTFDIAGNSIIQSKDNLNVIAMLIDTRTGYVANAAKVHVDGGADGLASPLSPLSQPAACFTLDGRRVSVGSVRGLVIERLSDGTTRKFIRRRP